MGFFSWHDTQFCEIITDRAKYRIESWNFLFQSREIFCGKFDREYFGFFYGVTKE